MALAWLHKGNHTLRVFKLDFKFYQKTIMRKKLFSIVISGLMLAGSVSCNKILEVEPVTSLPPNVALGTKLGLQAQLNGVYAGLKNGNYYGRDFVAATELMADNMKRVDPATQSGRGSGYDVNSPNYHVNIWANGFKTINDANIVISYVDGVADATEAEKASMKAQALFLRAVVYFDLAKSYGYNPGHQVANFALGVPVLTTPVDDVTKITYPERNTVQECFEQVERDLLESITQFGITGVNASAGEPYRGTRGAAQALLSRLYLYWGSAKLPDAVTQATAAIASGIAVFQPTASYVSMWTLAAKPESFFEVRFATFAEAISTPDNNSIQAWYQQQRTATGGNLGWGDVVIADNFMTQLEAGDIRAGVIIPYTRANGQLVNQTNKFQGTNGSFGWSDVPVIRISEMYLNRAEAYAYQGAAFEAQAQADLNMIRNRAGLPSITPTGQALIDAILKERRIELAFEGQRFFDLTRLGKDIPKETVSPILFTDYRILPPLPVADLQVNKNLIPNPGY
ncbi:MAG: RagB/SusD family nutrient uptake outer membrane protein [Chitinophagaceae bacterium]|nr:MAG: RagB/SusD family nutrient uptake outer membrane protein [Chitinophagaceae bacterium]